jgi:PBP1b-binding outer membrane lipoprotein LpoB
MKSKLSLKSLAKIGLKILPLILFLSACSSSVAPSFLKKDIPQAVADICKKEYKLDLITKLVDQTLWVYMPLEDIVTKAENPEKYIEKFSVEDKKNSLSEGILKVSYAIKPVAEKEVKQEMALDKKVNEKIFNVLQVIRRVLFSMDNSKISNPLFFCIVTADIKNGFEIKQIFHLSDLKKLSYGFISQTEYQHRIVQDTLISTLIINDTAGTHLDYQNITLEDFITGQIQNRIRIKFQKPEVEKNAIIDKEILKIVSYTLDTYNFRNFSLLEMDDVLNAKKTILNRAAVLDGAKD